MILVFLCKLVPGFLDLVGSISLAVGRINLNLELGRVIGSYEKFFEARNAQCMGMLVKHDIKMEAVELDVEREIPQAVGINTQRS